MRERLVATRDEVTQVFDGREYIEYRKVKYSREAALRCNAATTCFAP
jgi:hypothetical protein